MYCGIIQVEQLKELLQERYPQTDLKTLVLKLNQKCMDKTMYQRNIRPIIDSDKLPFDGVIDSLSIINESFTCFVLQRILMENKM